MSANPGLQKKFHRELEHDLKVLLGRVPANPRCSGAMGPPPSLMPAIPPHRASTVVWAWTVAGTAIAVTMFLWMYVLYAG